MAFSDRVKLVFCAGAGKEFMSVAVDLGWHTGSRSDETISAIHRPLYLLDTHWTDYDWPAHLAVAQAEHPALAVVPDIMTVAGLPLALAQAEEMAPHCDALCLVPKCRVIDQLPRSIAGTNVVLGYSVPSKYGASPLPLWEYHGWPVHLLGGTPRRQIDCAQYMRVVSADGNMAQKIALRGWIFDSRGHGSHLDTIEPREATKRVGMPARALAVSLTHIKALWAGAGFTIEERGRC
jgi:hypothetical protein